MNNLQNNQKSDTPPMGYDTLLAAVKNGRLKEWFYYFKNGHEFLLNEEIERLYKLGSLIQPYAQDTYAYLYENREDLLFEGSQGILLDIDFGTYPYVTSSSTGLSGVHSGSGVSVNSLDRVIGIVKAYTTRVGEGPFPTELIDSLAGDDLQLHGKEIGATTGRKRRCGWLDLSLLKYSLDVSQITQIALTKIDILEKLNKFKVCVSYEYNDQVYDRYFPFMDLDHVRPIYKEFGKEDLYGYKNKEKETKFFNFLEKNLKVPIKIVSFGPERNQTYLR